jgi:hypothetical protein
LSLPAQAAIFLFYQGDYGMKLLRLMHAANTVRWFMHGNMYPDDFSNSVINAFIREGIDKETFMQFCKEHGI